MRIRVVQSGGFAGLHVERALETDHLATNEQADVERLVTEACFFDLPARAVSGLPDVIQCRICVNASGREHEVTTDERSASAALWRLVERVMVGPD